MNIVSTYAEKRHVGENRVDTIKIMIGEADIMELMAQYPEYPEILEHYVVLYKPYVNPDEVAAEKDAVIHTVLGALNDDQALQFTDLYPVWMEGMALKANDRIQHEGGLYRVQQTHTAEHPPSVNTAALYTRINAPGEIPAWVTGQSYAKDVQVTHGGKTWLSMVDNNVWEPGASGIGDTIWREVPPAGL